MPCNRQNAVLKEKEISTDCQPRQFNLSGYHRNAVTVQTGRPLLIPSPWVLAALSLSLTLLLRPVVPAMPETLSLRELSMLVRMLLELDRLLARRASSGS